MDKASGGRRSGDLGVLLLLPFFLIRFGLLALLDRHALARAAHFAPMEGLDRAVYWVYQLSNAALLLRILTARRLAGEPLLLAGGWALYGAGLALLALSAAAFAAPAEQGVRQSGVYRWSRNPMYCAYFLFFLGCALLLSSPLLAALTLLFQMAAHRVILAEERWCVQRFGEVYLQYCKAVRRYF